MALRSFFFIGPRHLVMHFLPSREDEKKGESTHGRILPLFSTVHARTNPSPSLPSPPSLSRRRAGRLGRRALPDPRRVSPRGGEHEQGELRREERVRDGQQLQGAAVRVRQAQDHAQHRGDQAREGQTAGQPRVSAVDEVLLRHRDGRHAAGLRRRRAPRALQGGQESRRRRRRGTPPGEKLLGANLGGQGARRRRRSSGEADVLQSRPRRGSNPRPRIR